MAILHAHIEWGSRDCDGDMTGSYVLEMTEQEEADEFAEITFKDRVVASMVNADTMDGKLAVICGTLQWWEKTDEGFSRKYAEFCTEDGCDTSSTRRDHQAEAAGY